LSTVSIAASLMCALAPFEPMLMRGAHVVYSRLRGLMFEVFKQYCTSRFLECALLNGSSRLSASSLPSTTTTTAEEFIANDAVNLPLRCVAYDLARSLVKYCRIAAMTSGNVDNVPLPGDNSPIPPHVEDEDLVSFVRTLLDLRQKCVHLRDVLEKRLTRMSDIPQDQFSRSQMSSMSLDERRNTVELPLRNQIVKADRCHVLLCSALEDSLAILAQHSGVTEMSAAETSDLLTGSKPRCERIAKLLNDYDANGRVASQQLSQLLVSKDSQIPQNILQQARMILNSIEKNQEMK